MAFPTDMTSVKSSWLSSEAPIGHSTQHNLIAVLLGAIQTKIGIDNSADTNSLDYKVRKTDLLFNALDFYKYSIVTSVGNLIVNNSFETDLSGYSTYGSATNTRDTGEFYHGAASLKSVCSGASQGTYIVGLLSAGKRYTVSVYVKGTTGRNFNIYVSNDTHDQVNYTLTSSWTRVEMSFIASGSNGIFFRTMDASGATFYIDAVQVEEGTLTAGPFTTTQGNLTVALKNFEGNDPTATKPVKIQIGGVIRTITSACYINATIAGTNWGNAGSTELATKEIDWFVYILDYNNSGTVFNIGISRYPLYNNLSEATGGYTSEKYLIQAGNIGIENVVNIGRFNATLSAGGAYTWSIGTSVIINSPCYETRLLDWLPTVSGNGGMTVTGTIASQKYRLVGNIVFLKIENLGLTTGGTASTEIRFTLPFSNTLYSNNVCVVNDSGYKGSMCSIQVGPILGVSSSMTLGNWGLGMNREVFLSAQSTI